MCNARNRLVYNAVLNVAEDPKLFERYLHHPKREPNYRAGRSHSESVTSLRAEGYDFREEELIRIISAKFFSLKPNYLPFTP